MAFNGSGVFVRLYNWVNDRNANIKVRADRMDDEMDGIATGLSTCITKDGQTTTSAAIPFASGLNTDTINEKTSAAGVTIDGVLLKDFGATLKDSVTQFQDDGDATKQMRFQLSGITTGNTRVLTVPDFDGTVATLAGTETLTNKTLASAVYTGIQKWAKGADVASPVGGALTLGTDGNYFDITGTNAITSIVTVAVGTVVKLHFDAALTLTHHATDLILPGGASITTAAGDEAEFVEYASGDWRCTNYSKAALVPGGGNPVVRVYTSGDTWSKPSGLRYVRVRVQAGGAGGGGAAATAGGEVSAGGGGAAGGYSEKVILAAALGATETVTVGAAGAANSGAAGGAGGNSAFGTHATANGGTGGNVGTAGAGSTAGAAAGGTSASGNINISGGDGNGVVCTTTGAFSGAGGTSPLGTAGGAVIANNAGQAGKGYGGGGSGAANNASQSGRAGGAGAAGVVIVEEFY